MLRYYIQNVRKDDEEDIIAVKTQYSIFSVEEVISKIESRDEFYVMEGNTTIPVRVIQGENKKYIRTVKDGRETNNLDNLPRF